MADAESADGGQHAHQIIVRNIPSAFEQLITTKPPVLESLLAQLPTEAIIALYYTSSHLKQFFKNSPTSWRYISMRLSQPSGQSTALPANTPATQTARQSSNYALDKMLLYVIHPFSTRLTSLELDNTAVSGATVFQTVMARRTETLEHVSVRGCKNVSLKYHINPWLTMHAAALDLPNGERPPGFEKLALKSLYTYRCRHHRRRPYLPSSLSRKESDSEPTHELVSTCHKLGIWTDTAWCTTPGARCFRRRGYVTMRVPQDPREVWVVFDRLWRSRNWLGPPPEAHSGSIMMSSRKREKDCRSWLVEEEAMNGEPLGTIGDGKATPAHARKTHRQFVNDIFCDECADPILERCEQCSVMMHCSGCRKTLCASCAFDRPYLRNKLAPVDEKNKHWWAPGCAVSPCSMQDQDSPPPGPAGNLAQTQQALSLPSIKFKWCCTEPVFSGGGGITFVSGSTRDSDRIRAAPLPEGRGWEDPEFSSRHGVCSSKTICLDGNQQIGSPLSRADVISGPGDGRWTSIDDLFMPNPCCDTDDAPENLPRILCNECHASEQWKIKCKACSVALCLKHDVKERLRARICGYRDLPAEKVDYKSRQKALKQSYSTGRRKNEAITSVEVNHVATTADERVADPVDINSVPSDGDGIETPRPTRNPQRSIIATAADPDVTTTVERTIVSDSDTPARPVSPGSSSSGPPSRATSPTPSARSTPATPDFNGVANTANTEVTPPLWKGCQSFFCPSIRYSGDHRRRCVASMRICNECKVWVCEQCYTGLAPACPCKSCRISGSDGASNTIQSEATPPFFCPNCRWTRRKTGKCRRKIIEAKTKSQKSKSNNHKQNKRVQRLRKPVEARQSHQVLHSQTVNGRSEDPLDIFSDFMQSLDVNGPARTASSVASRLQDTQLMRHDMAMSISSQGSSNMEELQQLDDMGALARDLINRIQVLRQQFGPGSLTALQLSSISRQNLMVRAAQQLAGGAGSQQTLGIAQEIQPPASTQATTVPTTEASIPMGVVSATASDFIEVDEDALSTSHDASDNAELEQNH